MDKANDKRYLKCIRGRTSATTRSSGAREIAAAITNKLSLVLNIIAINDLWEKKRIRYSMQDMIYKIQG